MAKARIDLKVWRGNTETFRFRLKQDASTPVDLTGSVIAFRCVHDAGEIVKTSSDGGVVIPDPETGEFSIPLTVEETRAFPIAKRSPARYEVERRIGTEQKTVIYGEITVAGGLNHD